MSSILLVFNVTVSDPMTSLLMAWTSLQQAAVEQTALSFSFSFSVHSDAKQHAMPTCRHVKMLAHAAMPLLPAQTQILHANRGAYWHMQSVLATRVGCG